MDKIEEQKLIREAIKGDRKSFEALYYETKDRAYSLCYKLLGNQDDALDAMQEGYIKAYRFLPDFKFDARFETWLYRILTNASTDILRKRKPEMLMSELTQGEEEDSNPLENIASDEPGPSEELERRELRDEIAACLSKLSPEHREILILRDSEGLSYEEISEILDIASGTCKSRISRARNEFKRLFRNGEHF